MIYGGISITILFDITKEDYKKYLRFFFLKGKGRWSLLIMLIAMLGGLAFGMRNAEFSVYSVGVSIFILGFALYSWYKQIITHAFKQEVIGFQELTISVSMEPE